MISNKLKEGKKMNNNTIKKQSPFTPGRPVPIELFVGREKLITNLIKNIKYTKKGKQGNIFLVGDRGIGKSSLASFFNYYVNSKENMIGIHVFLGGISSPKEMVKNIFNAILKSTKDEKIFNKIRTLFGKYISEIGLFGISLKFNPPDAYLTELTNNFPEALNSIIEKVGSDKKGLFIILDDIDVLSNNTNFAHWYKSVIDKIATHYGTKFPVLMMLISTPDNRDKIYNYQPSINRIFNPITVERLNKDEVDKFFLQAFEKVDIKVKKDALEYMSVVSDGFPILMQEIGDSTFLLDKDNLIDKDDTFNGIFEASKRIGEKFLDPKVFRALQSERYKSILNKIVAEEVIVSFSISQARNKLNNSEKNVLHHFLRKFVELGVIEHDMAKGRGAYRFVNIIYPIYVRMRLRTKKW